MVSKIVFAGIGAAAILAFVTYSWTQPIDVDTGYMAMCFVEETDGEILNMVQKVDAECKDELEGRFWVGEGDVRVENLNANERIILLNGTVFQGSD